MRISFFRSREAHSVTSSGTHPPFARRVLAVWYRHYRVYTKHLISIGLPPFLEPLIFLAGIGLGMGKYVTRFDLICILGFIGIAGSFAIQRLERKLIQ